jgi:acetyl-CoA acetyltransferase
MSADRARDTDIKPVFVLGAAHAITHSVDITQMSDITLTAAAQCGPLAFKRAGVQPVDIDVAQLYDSFTITVLLALEDLGFCDKGEGGSFVESGALGPGGALPTNTDGGGLSACHPGIRSLFLTVEAVRQLRGESVNQVERAELALVHGVGGVLSAAATLVLGSQIR